MEPKTIMILTFVVLAVLVSTSSAGKHKKVIIHVPYKVKKIKHTHTVYKTIHHHHGHDHHGHGHDEVHEEHEHFHHHGDVHGHHSMLHPKFVLPIQAHLPIVPIVGHGR